VRSVAEKPGMLSLRQVSMLPLSRFGRPNGSPRYTLKPVAFRPKVPKSRVVGEV